MKKYLFFLLLILFNFTPFPQSKSSVVSELDNLLSDKFFGSTHAAVDIYDLTTQESLYRKNHKSLMHPASNMKILTSAAGLFFLGPDYNFETTLYYNGEIDGGVLNGDLYVVGGFDPEFSLVDMDYFIKAIDSMGIKEIKGNLFADVSRIDTLFWGKGWMWDDDPSTDSPYLSSLNINMNSVNVFVFGTKVGEKARIVLNPYSQYFEIVNETTTVPSDSRNSYLVTRDWVNRRNAIIVTGNVREKEKISGNERPFGLNVFQPDMYFLTLFEESLGRRGIKIHGGIGNFWLPYSAVHIRTFSRPFLEIIKELNKKSNNLNAEMVLYAMAEKFYGKPATAKNGVRVINNLISLVGMDPTKCKLVDGSGLSWYNLISAELIIEILKYIYYNEPELFNILIDSFPIAGIDGTLEERMKDSYAENNVKAKTGTLTGASTLSGFLISRNRHQIVFSIMIENYVNSTSTARAFQDEICKILAEYK
jgi:D-alanyl-D-alanine carboxypeptidase/D-alanyl-D-alanine-endopeptidase (penicillin-binding protein 4)